MDGKLLSSIAQGTGQVRPRSQSFVHAPPWLLAIWTVSTTGHVVRKTVGWHTGAHIGHAC